jgi:hypothetical protein
VSHFGTRYVVLACQPSEDRRTVVTLAEEEATAAEETNNPRF